MQTLSELIQPIDRDALRREVQASQPVPNFCIDGFLDPAFAERVADALPSFDEARKVGRAFNALNERGKVQITDADKFAPAVRELHRALASPEWLETLRYVMDLPNLVADPELVGGGIHMTGPRGRLDVHVDFNYIEERELHRRLNILIYFNRGWQEQWGGNIELWS